MTAGGFDSTAATPHRSHVGFEISPRGLKAFFRESPENARGRWGCGFRVFPFPDFQGGERHMAAVEMVAPVGDPPRRVFA